MPISGGTQFIRPQELLAKANIAEGMHVADLGCGNLGYFILPLARLVGKTGIAYAVDILPAALQGVRNRAKLQGFTNLETLLSNLEKVGSTKIKENSLDLVLMVNVLFQNKEHLNMLKEASRLLKPGATFIVVDWKKTGVPFGPKVEMRVSAQEIKNLAEQLDLQLVEETDFGDYFWGLIFKKAK